MNAQTSKQAGIGHVAALLLIVFLAVAGFAGYTVMMKNAAQPETSTIQRAAVEDSAAISNKQDLADTEKTLTDAEAELDSQLDDAALDADLDSML